MGKIDLSTLGQFRLGCRSYNVFVSQKLDEWRFTWQRDGHHFIPYGIIFIYHFLIGGYGLWHREFVLRWWHDIEHQHFIHDALLIASYVQTFYYYYLKL